MSYAKVYESTWDELAAHASELDTHPKLTLIVPQNTAIGTGSFLNQGEQETPLCFPV